MAGAEVAGTEVAGTEVAGTKTEGGVAVDCGDLETPGAATAEVVAAPGARRGVAATAEALKNAGGAR